MKITLNYILYIDVISDRRVTFNLFLNKEK